MFAIAITLLVLELSVPADEFDDLLAGILEQWPSYLAYLTSFLTIGGVWLVHHGILRRMRYADSWFVRVNLLLLLASPSCRFRRSSSRRRSRARAPSGSPFSSTG